MLNKVVEYFLLKGIVNYLRIIKKLRILKKQTDFELQDSKSKGKQPKL